MLTEPPASWDALKDALAAVDPNKIQCAIAVQLEWSQPSADVYNFLTRTLDLCCINHKPFLKTYTKLYSVIFSGL